MSEKVYDEQIAPLLKKAGDICQKEGISLVCLAEFGPNETATTMTLTGKQGIETTMTYFAAKAQGNADALIMALVKQAKEKGHNSLMLERCGA